MNPATELPTEAEVVADLKKIRTQDWSNADAFASLRALYDLLPHDERPARGDAAAIRDALLELLGAVVDRIWVEEKQDPPDLDQSIALAGAKLLKLDIPAGTPTQVDELVGNIVDTWKVRDQHTGAVRPMGIGTFKTGYMDRVVYPALAARLLSDASQQAGRSARSDDETTNARSAGEAGSMRSRPRRLRFLAGALLATLVVAGIALAATRDGRTDSSGHRVGTADRQCSRLANEAAQTPEQRGYPSAGGYEMGNFAWAANSRGDRYGDPRTVAPNGTVSIKARLSNSGPAVISRTCVEASPPTQSAPDPAINIHLISPYADPGRTSDTVSLKIRSGSAACIRLLPDTTQFQTNSGSVIATLSDRIFDGGVVVGPVGVPLDDVRFVAFMVKLDPKAPGQRC